MKMQQNWLKRLIALALVIVSLLQWLPAETIAAAIENARSTTVTAGDVNGDGTVDAKDVNLIRRHIAGGYNVNINTLAAEVNGDGVIDAKDVNLTRRYIAGGYDVELKPCVLYTVKFETGGGTTYEDKEVPQGTVISSFTKNPYWADHLFMGWCYDAELTQSVGSKDVVTKDMTLYANYLEQVPLETLETPNFASAEDVNTNFTITVVSTDPEMTAQEVQAAIAATNLADPDASGFISVSGSNGTYTITSVGGFNAGGTYRISLNSDKLTFKDQPESARDFNFTVHRDEVMNLDTNADAKYIPLGQISNITNNGQSVSTLDIALYEVNGDNISVTEMSTGTFTYTGTTSVQVGDIVCIYEGALPSERDQNTPKDQLGDMAFLEITAVNGSTYTYQSADTEDVLFMPDVLPMPEAADTDSDANTITVENKYLDYSADMYSYMNLDSQTVVGAGDFLAFYTGDIAVQSGENAAALTGYGKITAVSTNADTTTITFIKVTWEEVESSMDVYAKEEMTAQELLEGTDTENMESEIEQQALNSGFANEAALYMTSLALATDNFTQLSENMNLADYKVTLKDGKTVSPEELQLMAGGKVEVEIEETTIEAIVGLSPTHLGDIKGTNATKKGIVIGLDVTVVFTVAAKGIDGHLEITVTGSFIEEVGLDFVADAEAIWDVWGIFPYISDFRATANVDVLNYTAVSFNATMVTKENEDEEEEDGEDGDNDNDDEDEEEVDIAEEIKGLLESMTAGDEEDDESQEEAEENENKLIQRYSEMLNQESDWINIVEYNITEVKKSVPFEIPLINISFKADFVVKIDASISIGFDFEYVEGTRYVFTVDVKAGEVRSNTIQLQEKAYQFCFYAMGRIGLKAGVELGFGISVIDEAVAAVYVTAEAGAYTKLYGYFFYELKYTESQGKTSKYSGALLIQIGIYLEVGLEATAVGGYFSTEVTFLDKEWLLYQAGIRQNVLDFVTTQEEMPEIALKQYVRKAYIPNSVFSMSYLDLLTGDGETALYSDWNDPSVKDDFRSGDNFEITMTNKKFSYNPQTNAIWVNPDADDAKLEGEMIITFKRQPMTFTSKPLQRRISLYWDNTRDGYMIVPNTNGGSYIPMIIKGYEEKLEKPADPEKPGYNFAGWYSDEDLTVPYTFPATMPASDTNIYAKWEARTDIPYTVEHYQENFRSGEYELTEIEEFKGTTDTTVTPAVKNYTGYVAPVQAQLKVEADGSAILRYYYALERHNVTFDAGRVDGVEVTAEEDVTYNLKYGAKITAPVMAMKGYTFVGWTVDGTTQATVAETVGTQDLTYTAMWEKEANTEYRIEYYVQQADGRYTLQHMVKDKTVTGKVFTEEYLRSLLIDGTAADDKYIQVNAVAFENVTVKGIVTKEAAVDGNGKTVIKVNYGRIKHTLTFDPNYPGAEPIVKDMFYGAEIVAPQNMTRTGYTFVGWEVAPVAPVMPAESLTYRAVWQANTDTAYKVEHYQEQLDGSYALVDTDNETGTTETEVTPAVKNYEGFTAPQTQTVTVKADGTLVVEYKYTRNSYTIAFDADGGEVEPSSITAKYGESITLPAPTREGYGFDGWYNGTVAFTSATMVAENLTLTAQWSAGKIGYTVNHYQQNVDGNGYTLYKTDSGTASMDEEVTPSLNSYEGFTAPGSTTTITIKASAAENVVDYYYTRNQYTLTWELGIGSAEGQTYTSGKVYYGEEVKAPVPAKAGYTFTWNTTPVTVMPANDLTYTANWKENTYTVIFHANNGTDEQITKELAYSAALGENTFQYAGYTFAGWTDGVNTYTESTKLSQIITGSTTTLNLNAVWQSQSFTITYVGVEPGEHNNATEYTEGNAVSLTAPNARPGYTFAGWYDNSSFDGSPVDAITAGSIGNKTFYANWQENVYHIVLNHNDGTNMKDTYANLPYTGEWVTTAPTRSGYTFAGWALSADGAVVCSDGARLTAFVDANTASGAVIELFAKWNVVEYTITYDLGMHAASTTHNNPTKYSIETGEDIVLKDLTPKSGFRFGGWYDNAEFTGERINTIVFTNTVDYKLYAKWEHPGVYSITATEETLAGGPTLTEGFNATFTVKRTIPEGAVATSDVQTVYVRTLNGTAYGTTPEMINEEGQDQFHFAHTDPSQEGSGYLVFGPDSGLEQIITVSETDMENWDYMASSYRIGEAARYYFVQIYKVQASSGENAAIDAQQGKEQRDLPLTPYELLETAYTDWTGLQAYFSDGSTWKEVKTSKVYTQYYKVEDILGKALASYAYTSASKIDYRIGATRSGSSSSEVIIYNKDGYEMGWLTGWQSMYSTKRTWKDWNLSSKERFAFKGRSGKNPVTLGNVEMMLNDEQSAAAVNASPLAATAYSAGEEIMLTVIFNELISEIDTANGVPTLDLSGTELSAYLENAVYAESGVGTNALVFKATVKQDLDANEVLYINNILVNATADTFATAIGTLAAVVKDIMGN